MKRWLFLLLFLVLAAPAWAGQDEAFGAYDRKEYAKAARLLGPLADQGITKAQVRMAWLFSQGEGVAKDQGKAFKLYLSAAEKGHRLAAYTVGLYYRFGKGDVAKDDKQAAKWYRRSAEKGYAQAQHSLGRMLYFGEGITRDREKGLMWMDRSARQGNLFALGFLGNRHIKNQIHGASLKAAWMYLNLAARWGDGLSAKALRILVTPKISEADIEQAKGMQQTWLEETGLAPPPPRK